MCLFLGGSQRKGRPSNWPRLQCQLNFIVHSGSRGNKFHGGCVKSRYENHSEGFMILEQNHDRVGK